MHYGKMTKALVICAKSLSRVWLFVTLWIIAHQLLCPWDFSSKNTGMCCHFLLQGIFPTQGSNLHLLCFLYWQLDSLPLVPPARQTAWILSITLHGSLDLGKESELHIMHTMIFFFSFGKWDRRLLFSYRRMKNLQSWTGRMVQLQEAHRRQVPFSQLPNQPQGVTHLLCLLYNTSECLPLAKT